MEKLLQTDVDTARPFVVFSDCSATFVGGAGQLSVAQRSLIETGGRKGELGNGNQTCILSS
jgi:hypothetical protein